MRTPKISRPARRKQPSTDSRPCSAAARVSAAVLIASAIAACGGGSNHSVPPAGNVGPGGATVTSADGNATLIVPAGAVSAPIEVTLSPATDGYLADPQIIPGTVYLLDAPDTALALPATFSIQIPAGADRAPGSHKTPVPATGILDQTDLISCVPNVAQGAQVPPGTICVYHTNGVGGSCPPSVPLDLGVKNITPMGGLATYVIYCESPPIPKPQLAVLTSTGKEAETTTQSASGAAQTVLSGLAHKFFGLIVDKTPPVVQITTTFADQGDGTTKIHISVNATDDVGVVQVKIFKDRFPTAGPSTTLATFTGPPYVWDSGPIPNAQVFDIDCDLVCEYNIYDAVAVDAAGNQGVDFATTAGSLPLINSFIATPASLPFGGGDVVLSWGIDDVDHIFIDQGVGYVTGLSSKTVHVTAPTTFTLTAINLIGNSSATATVAVAAQPVPAITSFTATPSTVVAPGGPVTLSWTTTDASTLSIDHGIGMVTGTSVVVPSVAATTTFTLTATNAGGSVTATTTVTVTSLPLPVISAFSASPLTFGVGGGTVTLAWTVTGADSLSLSPVGPVTGNGTTANISSTTTFQLTATNASGSVMSSPITATVAVAADRYADATNGLDTNDCTESAPCKTIAKAFSLAASGHHVFLFDGTFGEDTQGGAAIDIPDGIALQALNPGAASLANLHFNALGSTSINGVVLDYVSNAGATTITATSTSGTPTLALTGVLMKYYGALVIGGSVHATMLPGALASGIYTAGLPDGAGTMITLQGNAQLLIQGGIIDGNNLGQPAFAGLVHVSGNSTLTLDGMTFRNRAQTVIGTADTAAVMVKNSTVFDHVSPAADGSACSTAIVLTGASSLSVDHSTMSNLPGGAICERNQTAVATIAITNSTFTDTFWGVVSEIGGAEAAVTIDHSSFTGGAWGIKFVGLSAATSVSITNTTIQGMSQAGAYFDGSGSHFKLRSCSLLNNVDGVDVYDAPLVDLGTAADPGNNTLTGNSTTALHASLGDQNGDSLSVTAVGNTWVPNTQGADGNGHYGDGVVATGSGSGLNYVIANGSSSIDL